MKGQSAHALQCWTHSPHWEIGIPFQVAPPVETVFTDASSNGWGVAFKGTMWSGTWQRSGHHINLLELRAVLVASQLFQFRLKEKTTIFMIDNATTVSYLKKQGDQIASVTQTVNENTETCAPATDQHSTKTNCVSTECTSRPGVAHVSGNSIGMVAIDGAVPVGNERLTVGSIASGHVCKQ